MNSTVTFTFGAWLKKLRKQLGYSRQQVCDQAGGRISQQYIHFIETGKSTNIGSDKLQALAQGFQIPIEILEEALFRNREPNIEFWGKAGKNGSGANGKHDAEPMTYIHPEKHLFALEINDEAMTPKLEPGDLAIAQTWHHTHGIMPNWVYLIEHQGKTFCSYIVENSDGSGSYQLVAEQSRLFSTTPLTKEYEILGRVIEVRKTKTLHRSTSTTR
jgi:transcriptional regulator with XRE-family HTH domain